VKQERALCCTCGRERVLRTDGLLGAHKRAGPGRGWCPGSHRPPGWTDGDLALEDAWAAALPDSEVPGE
jgi:hypothetical protein